MSILKIARMGHTVLRTVAKPVDDPKSPEIRRLVENMIDTLEEEQGVGLAAPQLFTSLRVIIFLVPQDRSGGTGLPLTVLINPVIEPLSEETAMATEGCLSLPGLIGVVPRWTRILYRGLDMSGREITREAKGFHARVVQHECDHLDGVLYPMRMTDMSTFGYVEEIRRCFAIKAANADASQERQLTENKEESI